MCIKGEILPVTGLSDSQKEMMFQLMFSYFDGIDRGAFTKDLSEKEWVIILRDSKFGQIQGFSTQMILENKIDGVLVRALFSGDTIINKRYWGSSELFRVWIRFALSLRKIKLDAKLYWFLISMGYRTYRMLPVFFKEFYPRYDKQTPEFEKKIIDAFAYQKYPAEYEGRTGLIHLKAKAWLKPKVSDITAHLLKNPHVDFFCRRNPSNSKGNELACITEISENNFKNTAIRLIDNNSLSGEVRN